MKPTMTLVICTDFTGKYWAECRFNGLTFTGPVRKNSKRPLMDYPVLAAKAVRTAK